MIKSASIFAIILLYTSTAWSGMQAPRKVVAAGGGSTKYQIASCHIYITSSATSGENTMMAVYSSDGTRIAQTAETAIGTSGFPKFVSNAITSGPTLTPGSTYYIAITGDSYLDMGSKSTPAWQLRTLTRGTWPAIPSTISPTTDTEGSGTELGMYCANASGQVLIGSSSTTALTETSQQGSGNQVLYFASGYTCNSL